MDSDVFHAIVQSGFSVGVAAFLLIRLEKELKALTQAIQDLKICQVCEFRRFVSLHEERARNEISS